MSRVCQGHDLFADVCSPRHGHAPSTDLPPYSPMVFRRRGGIKDCQGRGPSKDALLRIGSGSPGSSANLVVEAIIAHHGLLATRVQTSSSRWYGGIATRLTGIRARLEIWEIEHIKRSCLARTLSKPALRELASLTPPRQSSPTNRHCIIYDFIPSFCLSSTVAAC